MDAAGEMNGNDWTDPALFEREQVSFMEHVLEQTPTAMQEQVEDGHCCRCAVFCAHVTPETLCDKHRPPTWGEPGKDKFDLFRYMSLNREARDLIDSILCDPSKATSEEWVAWARSWKRKERS